ncbi:hypothetical protein ACHHV8_11070 [Paenibacillus sp. TAB 01]|uniref:hypothetical protein n=1 Tax=Paenibacillus sp. TAB 01 TaxID=3368988 RepID=UPI0037523EA0
MNMDLNRFGNFNRTRVLELVMQQYKVYIVKSENILRPVETNYMYFLTNTIQTVEGQLFEELIDFHYTVIPDDVWCYVLASHVNFVPEPDDQFIESMMLEINALIS